MKNIFIILGLMLLTPIAAIAETLKVEAVTPFNTVKPVSTMDVKITENVIYEGENLLVGDIVHGDIVKVKGPTRLKRNARFSFIPIYYTDAKGVKHTFKEKNEGKYALPIEKGKMAANAALTVGNHFVKGISMGVHAVKGAIENEEDNRLKSAGVSLYENSPLSYVEEGNELDIKKGDKFYLKFAWDINYEDEELD